MKTFAAHSHKAYEIICCASGNYTVYIEEKEYFLKKNDIIIIPPNTVHKAMSDIEFTDIYVQAQSINSEGIQTLHDESGRIFSLMLMLESILIEKGMNYQNIADSILDVICNYLVQLMNVKYKYPFTEKLKNAILEGFSSPDFDLEEAVRNTGYNKDYLRRCFEEDIGKSPLGFLTELRIDKARSLLLQSDFGSVCDVARRCGFSDSLYFSTVFKKHVGLSPLSFRKNKTI